MILRKRASKIKIGGPTLVPFTGHPKHNFLHDICHVKALNERAIRKMGK